MSTLLNILALLKTNSRTALIVVLCFVSAYMAHWLTKARYEAQIATEREQTALAIKEQGKDYERRLSEATSKLVLESRRADANRAERDDLLRRLRVASARADGASANSDRSYRAEYAQCRKFLSEGAGLLSEGSELAGRIAREKDALATLVH
nr:MAG TPA: hypothetical protein [Caudoviricetes sp.]